MKVVASAIIGASSVVLCKEGYAAAAQFCDIFMWHGSNTVPAGPVCLVWGNRFNAWFDLLFYVSDPPPPLWGRTVRCARAVRKVGCSPPPGVR